MKKSYEPAFPTFRWVVEKIGQNKKNASPYSARQNKQEKRKRRFYNRFHYFLDLPTTNGKYLLIKKTTGSNTAILKIVNNKETEGVS